MKEEKSSSSGQKRPLLEGDEKDGGKVERDGKRQKVQGVELEAQLELKITAKGGSRLKLEKVGLFSCISILPTGLRLYPQSGIK